MTRIHVIRAIRRMACTLAGLAGALLALSATSPAAYAYRMPPTGGAGATTPATPQPPGWNKHPPVSALHATAHTVVTAGMPGWQIALIAIASAVLAAAVAVTVDRILTARQRVNARAA